MKTLVTIATYKKASTAYFLKENLEYKDIDCFFAFTSISLQDSDEVQIQVKGEDVERAVRIMMEIKDKYGQDIESLESVRHVRKIIVPTDFSSRSEEACYYAVHLAQKLQAEIKIVHVYEKPIVIVTGASGFIGSAVCIDLAKDFLVVAIDRREPTLRLREVAPLIIWHILDISDNLAVNQS